MSWYKRIILVGLLLIPIVLQFIWQFANLELPIADGGDHFRIAHLIYLSFSDGFGEGRSFFVNFVYTGGKPILFSAFAAPFIFFSKFDVLLPIRLFLVIVQIITALGYYWLFSSKIKPPIAALLASVITTTPFIFSINTQFMPEGLWHMWFVLFLAALLRSNNLTNSSMATLSGVALGLTILARPVESIVSIFPVLCFYFYYLYKERILTSILSVCVPFLTASIPVVISFLCSVYRSHFFIGAGSIALASLTLTFLSVRREVATSESKDKRELECASHYSSVLRIERFFLPVSILGSGWLLFYGKPLLIWAYDNSFGDGAKLNDQVNLTKNMFSIFLEVVSVYGTLSIGVLLFLGVLSIIPKKNEIDRRTVCFPVISIILALAPMLLAYSVTGTSDMRRIYLGVVFLLIVSCFLIFWKNGLPKAFKNISVVGIVLLLFVQIFSITAIISDNTYLMNSYLYLVSTLGQVKTPGRQKSEDANVIKEIKAAGIADAKIAVFSLGMFTKRVLYQAESLKYITLGIDRSLKFSTMWAYTDYEPYGDVINRLRDNEFDYLLLEELDNPIPDSSSRAKLRSHTFFVEELLAKIRSRGESDLPDLHLVKKFKISDRFQYLFKIGKPYGAFIPKITTTSQLGNFGPEGLAAGKQPGWHSASAPKYPQRINVDLIVQRNIGTVGFLPQDGNVARAPKSIRIRVSSDGQSWVLAGVSEDNCNANAPLGWHNVKLAKQVQARFLEIDVFANCGAPDLLTLRGLRVE